MKKVQIRNDSERVLRAVARQKINDYDPDCWEVPSGEVDWGLEKNPDILNINIKIFSNNGWKTMALLRPPKTKYHVIGSLNRMLVFNRDKLIDFLKDAEEYQHDFGDWKTINKRVKLSNLLESKAFCYEFKDLNKEFDIWQNERNLQIVECVDYWKGWKFFSFFDMNNQSKYKKDGTPNISNRDKRIACISEKEFKEFSKKSVEKFTFTSREEWEMITGILKVKTAKEMENMRIKQYDNGVYYEEVPQIYDKNEILFDDMFKKRERLRKQGELITISEAAEILGYEKPFHFHKKIMSGEIDIELKSGYVSVKSLENYMKREVIKNGKK